MCRINLILNYYFLQSSKHLSIDILRCIWLNLKKKLWFNSFRIPTQDSSALWFDRHWWVLCKRNTPLSSQYVSLRSVCFSLGFCLSSWFVLVDLLDSFIEKLQSPLFIEIHPISCTIIKLTFELNRVSIYPLKMIFSNDIIGTNPKCIQF